MSEKLLPLQSPVQTGSQKYSDWNKGQLISEVERLRKRKKYGLVWEDKPEDVVERCRTELPVLKEVKNKTVETGDTPANLFIEADNYHALSVLNYTHKGKIDVIYIDPPYNTGARDWKYNNDYVSINDAYRHSKWLSMMKNRLVLAKKLLKPDGVFICAIDENEQAHLGVLLEEIFPKHKITCISIVHNPRGIQGKNFAYCHDFAFFVFPDDGKIYIQNKTRENALVEELRDHGGSSRREDARNCFYPFLVKGGKIIGVGDVPTSDFHPKGKNTVRKGGVIEIWPIDRNGVERKWVFAKDSVVSILDKLNVDDAASGEKDIFRTKDEQRYKTVWIDPKYDNSTYGSKIVAEILGTNAFSFPKSLFTVKDCLEAVVKNNKDAIILDFFAGSGTTGHAVLEINKDGGNRRFILCTNNENNIASDVCYPRIAKVIEGYKNVDGEKVKGLGGNLRYFKTAFVGAEPNDKNKEVLTREATEMLCMREDTFEAVKDTKLVKIFKSNEKHTGIIFDEDSITTLKKDIAKIGGKWSVYVFSLSDDTFDDEFEDMKKSVTVAPIPEAILRVYRRIFQK